MAEPHCRHFTNRDCEYYPCHGLDGQNCLFCYCPLYFLDCGGDWKLAGGVKDCSDCVKVHDDRGWEFVQAKLKNEISRKKELR